MVARMNASYKGHAAFLPHRRPDSSEYASGRILARWRRPLRPQLEQQAAASGLGSCAIFLGDRSDISAVLASIDVAVLTSDSESLSNVILEAMAANLPVVAFSVGGNPELVNESRGALSRLEMRPGLRMPSTDSFPTPTSAAIRPQRPSFRGRELHSRSRASPL
jgi:glycosyltransferase involved in cell wall biosynthesis